MGSPFEEYTFELVDPPRGILARLHEQGRRRRLPLAGWRRSALREVLGHILHPPQHAERGRHPHRACAPRRTSASATTPSSSGRAGRTRTCSTATALTAATTPRRRSTPKWCCTITTTCAATAIRWAASLTYTRHGIFNGRTSIFAKASADCLKACDSKIGRDLGRRGFLAVEVGLAF